MLWTTAREKKISSSIDWQKITRRLMVRHVRMKVMIIVGKHKRSREWNGTCVKGQGESQINTVGWEWGVIIKQWHLCHWQLTFVSTSTTCTVERKLREWREHMEITETHIWCLMIAYDSPMHLVPITITPKRKFKYYIVLKLC